MVGSVLRFHIFDIVVWARPERLDSSYIVYPRSSISSLILHFVSTAETSWAIFIAYILVNI